MISDPAITGREKTSTERLASPPAKPGWDRRRPGRAEASPALVHLLRSHPELSPVRDGMRGVGGCTEDSRRPARGILAGTALGLLIWALIWVVADLLA